MIVKTDAIVLRGRHLRETSRFLTLYTASFGKIEVVAKGIRQPKSKLRGVLEPFNEISAVMYRKEHRGVSYLSDAELIHPRHSLSSDYERLSVAFGIAELTDAVMHHEETNAPMYALLRTTFDMLDQITERPGGIFAQFQFQLIHVLGFEFYTEVCSNCGGSMEDSGGRWFSPTLGGLRCGTCGRGAIGTKISPDAYTLLNSLGSSGTIVDAQPAVINELRGMLNAYILHHTESRAVLRAGSMLGTGGWGLVENT